MPGPDLIYLTISQEVTVQHIPVQNSILYANVSTHFFQTVLSNWIDDEKSILDQGWDAFTFSQQVLASKLYQLSPPEDLSLATMLVTPFPSLTDPKVSEEMMFTKEKYGSVRQVYIVADQDAILIEEIQRWMIELNPPDEVKVINGSDHMTMISKPKELCSCLEKIAQQYY